MGVSLILYADDNNGMAARANAPHFWQVLAPNLGVGSSSQFTQVKVLACPSYPDPDRRYPGKIQLVCYVVNGWTFSSATDPTGSELQGLSKITTIQRPVDTIYLADREDGTDYGPITATDPNSNSDYYDVWQPGHLPYLANGTESPRNGVGNTWETRGDQPSRQRFRDALLRHPFGREENQTDHHQRLARPAMTELHGGCRDCRPLIRGGGTRTENPEKEF